MMATANAKNLRNWESKPVSKWNATVGKDLISVDYDSSEFVACQVVQPATTVERWLLAIQVIFDDAEPATLAAAELSTGQSTGDIITGIVSQRGLALQRQVLYRSMS